MNIKHKPVLCFLLLVALFSAAFNSIPAPLQQTDDDSSPDHVVKLIFIHHSTGGNWLNDGYGELGKTLSENNYFVSDTNYGWGPEAIGDRTDIPNWLEWFAGENTPVYVEALLNENGQNASYTRTLADPGGKNEIIMFKSCFPNSALKGRPDDPPDPDGWLSVGHAKYVYNEILGYFATRPDKLFVVVTAPPLSSGRYAKNARAFNNWLMDDWLRENNYTLNNVVVFDFYNVLTGPDAHHWFYNGQAEHIPGSNNTLYYPSDDDHPSAQGSRKATDEFVPLLNFFYRRWKSGQPAEPPVAASSAPENSQPGSAQVSSLIDDFENGPLAGTSGWEAYYQDDTDTALGCIKDSSLARSGANSLKFEFDVAANSWATCGIYYDSIQNWSNERGVSFYLRASRADIPFDVDLFGGTPGARTSYIYRATTPAESTNNWALVQIPWGEIARAEWEENPGTPLNPAEVTGFAIGLSTPENSRISGTIWLDDLSLMSEETSDAPDVQPSVPGQLPICRGSGAFPLILLGLALWKRRIRR